MIVIIINNTINKPERILKGLGAHNNAIPFAVLSV